MDKNRCCFHCREGFAGLHLENVMLACGKFCIEKDLLAHFWKTSCLHVGNFASCEGQAT
jgi:hypothetical protein